MILHTLNRSPFTHNHLSLCLKRMSTNDALLLLEDGVLAALQSQPLAESIKNIKCFAIANDIEARGLTSLIPNITLIDFNRFVELSCEYDTVLSWY